MSAIAIDRYATDRYKHWDMNRLGTNANLLNVLAALLPHQIETIDRRLPQRREVAERYRDAFGNEPLRLIKELSDTKCAEHIFPIGVPGGRRDEGIDRLNEAGFQLNVNFRSVMNTRYYSRKYPGAAAECPNACHWGEQTLTLPMYASLARAEQDYVIEVVAEQVYPLARPSS
jgi:dTDP-4-amino-4,6-dideoxygalactose transaminase